MKQIVFFIATIASINGFSQSKIEWSSDYEMSLSDFQSAQTEINEDLQTCSIYSGSQMDFLFQMSVYEFAFTKNFNSKVGCTFDKKSAAITAYDTTTAERLIDFANYQFDLTELYCRKFRKELYEKKGTFSNASFFQPIFDQLQAEMNEESARVMKNTELGVKSELLRAEHNEVLNQIEGLSHFCKSCKPPKRKKKK